jgi:putative ABC transport system permease protein
MLAVTLKGLVAHRRRLFGTLLAIVLGVGFLAGTLTFNNTLSANFDTLFQNANAHTDAVVRGSQSISAGSGTGQGQRPPLNAALVGTVAALPGVASAQGEVDGYGQILGANGKPVGTNGPPRAAGNWIPDADLNPYHLVAGRAPQADDEVVLNKGAADSGGLHVGDKVLVQTPTPVTFTIVGLAGFGSEDGIGQETYVGMTMHAAQMYVGKPGEVSRIVVKAAPGVSQSQVVQRINAVLPHGVEAITGAAYTQETIGDINSEFLSFFETFLVVFAVIALIVASFSIYNTFAIVVAQRTRESALLRALGALRRQVLGAVVLEAATVALLASVLGVLGGLGIAELLKAVFGAAGFGLPAGGLDITVSTVVISVITGTAVTIVAALAPAVRASRVPPLAALRDVEAGRTTASRRRVVIGVVGLGAGIALAAAGSGVAAVGTGCALAVFGTVVLGPAVARPVAGLLGAVLPRLDGTTGRLARRNAMRDPKRTAATATALMVGVAVVTVFTVFAASIKASIDTNVRQSFTGDLVVSSPSFNNGGTLSPKIATDLAALAQVRGAVGIGTGVATVNGKGEQVYHTDPAKLGVVTDPGVVAGSMAGLGTDGIALSQKAATADNLRLGSTVTVGFTDGATGRFTVDALYTDEQTLGDYLMSTAAWAPHEAQDVDTSVAVKLAPGVSLAQGRAVIERAVAPYGSPQVEDRGQYAADQDSGVTTILNIIYALLALAIIIALMGIANSLSLSVHERTRELGMLRAVGLTRRQTRRTVRWESVIVALFGTLTGIALGVLLGWALVRTASSSGGITFAAPATQLVVVTLAGAVAGVLAGARPARRAAKINVLAAIAQD